MKKPQKGFAIVNIVVGVILFLASFAMFSDPSTGPGGAISLVVGAAFWITGGVVLARLRGGELSRGLAVWNAVVFGVSCLALAACVALPILAPML